MDIDKLIYDLDELVVIARNSEDIGVSKWLQLNSSVADVKELLEKQLKDKWIPVKERLPDIRQRENGEPIEFIVMIRDAVVPTVLSIDKSGNWFDFMCHYHGMPEHLSISYDVLAWRPLPEPYKEKFNEG